MRVYLKRISTGNKLIFPSMPKESVNVTTQNKYQNFNILNKGEIAQPTGPEVREYKWSGIFFGRARKNSALITKWKSPQACIKTLLSWKDKRVPLKLVITGTGINQDVTIKKFTYSPTGGHGDFEYTIELVSYTEVKISGGTKTTSKKASRNSKPKKKVYTVKKNHKSRNGICKISKKYYGTTSKWKTIYTKNKKKIEKAAKKHGRKSSDKGKYLYKGTKLTIP